MSMKHSIQPRNKCKLLWSINLTKEARICNREKTVSSISGARKTGNLHVKKMN